MSTIIDQRIVEMAFHNENFERNAKQTLKTLQELNDASNMEGAVESFSAMSKATSKSLGLKPVTKQANLLSRTFNTMGKVAKTAFNGITSPIHALTNSLKTFGGYAQTVLGFNIANKLIGTGEQLIRAFTIDPLRTGWNEYELKMDSIKTIMSGSSEDIKVVKAALEQLNKYADDTVYSFSDMTSNIGKFTNNGVKLNDAVTAMKGISNAAADAGQGTNQASMAMYNLSQAISMGKLTTLDWKSIENANMATLRFKQTFIDSAVALGQLEKQGDKYFTKTGKKEEVTAENFRNTLQEGWATTDVILAALKIYSGELNAVELAAMGLNWDDIAQHYEEVGRNAHLAATEVRTFTKMMDALKEAAQSGWAMSMEYIFGDMNEATNLWTELNNRFSKALSDSANARNDLLLGWRGKRRVTNDDGTEEIKDIEGAIDGREVLIQSLWNILDTVSLVSKGIRQAWTNIFGELTSEKLLSITQGFQRFTESIKNWFGSLEDPSSRISKISKAFEGLFSIVKIAWNVISPFVNLGVEVLKPVIDFIIELLGAIGTLLSGNFDFKKDDLFSNLKKSFKSLTKEKVSTWFKKTTSSITNFFSTTTTKIRSWAKEHGFENIIDNISNTFSHFKDLQIWKDVRKVFDNIFSSFQPTHAYDESGSILVQDSPFVSAVKKFWEKVKGVFEEVKGWDIWDDAAGIFRKIFSIFEPTHVYEESGIISLTDSPFVAAVKQFWENVKGVFEEVKGWGIWEDIGQIFENIFSFFRPVTIIGKQGNTWTKDSPFVTWIKQAYDTISSLFGGGNNIDGAPSKFDQIITSIMSFLVPSASAEEVSGGTNLLDIAVSAVTSSWDENKGEVDRVATEVEGAMTKIKEAPEKLNEEPSGGWSFSGFFQSLNQIITDVWNTVKEPVENTANKISEITTSVQEGLEAFVNFVVTTNWEKVLSDAESHLQTGVGILTEFSWAKLIGGLGSGAKGIGKAGGAFGKIGESLSELFGTLGKTAEESAKTTGETLGKLGSDIGQGVKDFADNFDRTKRLDAIGNVVLKFAGAVAILAATFYGITLIIANTSPTDLEQAKMAIQNMVAVLGAIALLTYNGGTVSQKLGNSVLYFAAGVYILYRALKGLAIASADKDIDLNGANEVLTNLTLLIGAFEALSTAEGSLGGISISLGKNKKTGLIGFVIALEGLILETKQLSGMLKSDEGQYLADRSVKVLDSLAGIITKFQVFSSFSVSVGKLGSVSTGGKSSGLIGFALSISAMVNSLGKLGEIEPEKADKGVNLLKELSGIINTFEVWKGAGEFLGSWGNKKASGTGLIGFVAAIEGLILEMVQLGNLDPVKAGMGLNMLKELANIIDKFKVLSGVGNALSNIGATPASAVTNLGSLTLLIGGIALLLWEVSEIAKEGIATEDYAPVLGAFSNIASVLSEFGEKLAIVVGAFAVINTAGAWQGIKSLAIAMAGVAGIAAIMGGLQIALEAVFSEKDLEAFPGKVEKFGQIYVAIGDVIGSIFGEGVGALEGQRTIAATRKLVEAANYAKDIDKEGLERLEQSMKSMRGIAETLKGFDPSLWDRLFNGSITLGTFASYMEELGKGLSKYNAAISDIGDWTNIGNATNMLIGLAAAMSLVEISGAVRGMSMLGTQLDLILADPERLEAFKTTYQLISKALSGEIGYGLDEAKDKLEEAPSIANTMSRAERIAKGLEEIQPTISPVVDESSPLSIENGTMTISGTAAIDALSFDGVISAINNGSRSIVSAVNSLGHRISGVEAAIRNMQIVLNTGAIAGAVGGKIQGSSGLRIRTMAYANFTN